MLRTTLQRTRAALAHLYRDEQGAEGLEKLLIIGAIALPLLGVLILLRDKISEWLGNSWEDATQDATLTPPNITAP